MTTERVSFAALVLRHRTARLLTQEELAEKSGLSARAIQNIEAGRVLCPRRATVALLRDAFGLAGPEWTALDLAAREGRAQAAGPRIRRTEPSVAASVAAAAAHLRAGLELLVALDRPDALHAEFAQLPGREPNSAWYAAAP